MKLSVNFIGQGRYWKALEEIPDEDVPTNLRRYAVSEDNGQASEMTTPSTAKPKRTKWGKRPTKR